jgi:hypothetical protein
VGFEGDKLTVISEFAVKTVLEKFKMAIEKGGHTPMMRLLAIDLEYTLLLTTLNIRCTFLCCREQSNKRTKLGTITYNTVLQKWMSEISEGNKFSMAIGSGTYTTGFYDSARAGIWKEDELTDPVTGKFIRARLRGVDYEYGFEIVLNKEPALEKC